MKMNRSFITLILIGCIYLSANCECLLLIKYTLNVAYKLWNIKYGKYNKKLWKINKGRSTENVIYKL